MTELEQYILDQKKKRKKWLIIGGCVVLGIGLIFFIRWLIYRPTPMPPDIKAKIENIELDNRQKDTAISMLYQRLQETQIRLDELAKRGVVIKQDIQRNEARKVDIKQENEKINNSVNNWSMDDVDSFLTRRYGHK